MSETLQKWIFRIAAYLGAIFIALLVFRPFVDTLGLESVFIPLLLVFIPALLVGELSARIGIWLNKKVAATPNHATGLIILSAVLGLILTALTLGVVMAAARQFMG
jgi:hypothetical protein